MLYTQSYFFFDQFNIFLIMINLTMKISTNIRLFSIISINIINEIDIVVNIVKILIVEFL